jgi:signal transduction histidine kinase
MARSDVKLSSELPDRSLAAFNYSYVVLAILFLLTVGATLAYYQHSAIFADETGTRWTPVVFLIGLCVSLVIFGMTHREATASISLQERTLALLEAQQQNERLLIAEQISRIAAEEANLAKDEFLALVSHELKTPLNAIAGWNRILKTEGVSEETRHTAVEKIDKNLRIQASIVDELLSFSDVMSRSSILEKSPVPVRELFEDAVNTVNVAAFQKGVSLIADDALNGQRVFGDGARITLAIVNVLANAVKFTPPGGRVEARAYESGGFIRLVISDDGIGMEADIIPHIFEKYRQSERASTRRYGGLGLGLTIAEKIIKLHNGSIDAESPGIGSGSTFTISIPSAA